MATTASTTQRLRVPLYKNIKHVRSGPKSYARALAKFGINPTKEGPIYRGSEAESRGVLSAAKGALMGAQTLVRENVLLKRDTASDEGDHVPATDIEHDAEYLCPVEIGSPAQKLMLDFDTGSSDLWVWSDKLPSNVKSEYASKHTIYDSTKSSTFKNMSGSTWQISYGDGSSSSGTVGTDNVVIGSVTVEKQAVELANNLSTEFQQGAGDGLLGLGYPNINTVKPAPVATPVKNMIDQSDIPKGSELFTAWLGSWKDADSTEGTSWYTFGFIDADALKSLNVQAEDVKYTPVDSSNGFWQFASTSAKVNGKVIQLANNTAIADTGTTLALVSDQVCEAVYDAIPGATYDYMQQGYVLPTNTAVDKLPEVQVAVGDNLFSIHKEDLIFADAGNGMSYGGIQSRGSMPLDILGDTFLKGVYAVFDQGNERFGAVQRPEEQGATQVSGGAF
ncbi:MAG: hypothetical protein Q9159_002726 [Coniocarpon cinnabarinum]